MGVVEDSKLISSRIVRKVDEILNDDPNLGLKYRDLLVRIRTGEEVNLSKPSESPRTQPLDSQS